MTPGHVYDVPYHAVEVTIELQRTIAGLPMTVPLTVVDTCGAWPTFVRGGAIAGQEGHGGNSKAEAPILARAVLPATSLPRT